MSAAASPFSSDRVSILWGESSKGCVKSSQDSNLRPFPALGLLPVRLWLTTAEGRVPVELHWSSSSDSRRRSIKQYTIAGRVRMCASMEGNAIFALLKLGEADERIDRLAQRLLDWQWPDGGWNCDKNRQAHVSSFTETILP